MRKKILFRISAVLLALSPFVALEAVCRIFDLGRPTNYSDPFIGFSDIHPLFVLNEQTKQYQIPTSRLSHFCEDGFAAKKTDDEYRVFVLGGSTVQGRPWAIETSFSRWLELSLTAADPSRRWRIVNCGGISYASYRLIPILKEVLHYSPDLIVVCTGHNEFLEDRTYGHIKRDTGIWGWSQRTLSRLRTFTLLRSLFQPSTENGNDANRPKLSAEVQAKLDYRNGLKLYKWDEKWRNNVMAHFAFNVQTIIDITRQANVPLLLVCPVSNLDWPPFKSEHPADLADLLEERFAKHMESAKRFYRSDLRRAIDLLTEAKAIDGRHAHLHYEIGKCYFHLGFFDEARNALMQAKELDVCPLRMLQPMRNSMTKIAAENDTPFFDAHAFFEERSTGQITGAKWLVDHVHPTIAGHKEWARALLDELVEMKVIELRAGWQEARDASYRRQMKQLDKNYFLEGERTFKAVQRWAHGLADKERPE